MAFGTNSELMFYDKTTPLEAPVLFMVFNRPEKTQRVFDVIRSVRPKKLYVAVDAPRENRPDDTANVKKVKEIVSDVDWPCDVKYLFHKKNQGCTKAGLAAWKWIFEYEDRMIFVEDDGLGSIDTFYFVQDMLERYKNDARVAYVGTVNYGPKYGDKTYFFSRISAATYFMGTWKRVFNEYEYDLESYYDVCRTKEFRRSFVSWQERKVYNQLFKSYIASVRENRRYNTYDVQMEFYSFKHHAYSIYPNINLCSNIGLDGGANNQCDTNSTFYQEYGNRKIEPVTEIIYNDDVEYDPEFEELFFKKRVLYGGPWYKRYLKSMFLRYLGGFYSKHIKKYRRR